MPKQKQTTDAKHTLAKALPYILIIGGILGIICSFIITQDKFKLLENPNYHPLCDLNPVISCGSVMQSKQGAAFGFPNPFIGLAAFAVLITIGMAMKAGAIFKRWFWLGLELGAVFGIGFVHWLFFESVYRIHALCPYCMVVWIVTITTFWYVTLYNIEQKNIVLPKGAATTVYSWVRRHHIDILVLWLLIIAGLILKHFWYYYGHHL
jgi:uncharacterized membrane protein